MIYRYRASRSWMSLHGVFYQIDAVFKLHENGACIDEAHRVTEQEFGRILPHGPRRDEVIRHWVEHYRADDLARVTADREKGNA